MDTYRKRPYARDFDEAAFFKLIAAYRHSKKRKRTVHVDETYLEELDRRYLALTKIFKEWDISVQDSFTRHDQLSIGSMLTYFHNIFNGFGRRNDEVHYAYIRKEDVSGDLFREATRGFSFSKVFFPLILLIFVSARPETLSALLNGNYNPFFLNSDCSFVSNIRLDIRCNSK